MGKESLSIKEREHEDLGNSQPIEKASSGENSRGVARQLFSKELRWLVDLLNHASRSQGWRWGYPRKIWRTLLSMKSTGDQHVFLRIL